MFACVCVWLGPLPSVCLGEVSCYGKSVIGDSTLLSINTNFICNKFRSTFFFNFFFIYLEIDEYLSFVLGEFVMLCCDVVCF